MDHALRAHLPDALGMQSIFLSRATLLWFVLVAATVLSWEFGHGIVLDNIRDAGVAIIAVAMVKMRYVILDFMELRHAPMIARVLCEIYCAVLCLVLVALFLCAPS